MRGLERSVKKGKEVVETYRICGMNRIDEVHGGHLAGRIENTLEKMYL